jgi:hypothetical protein
VRAVGERVKFKHAHAYTFGRRHSIRFGDARG